MKNKVIIIIALTLVTWSIPNYSYSASLFFDSEKSIFYEKDEFLVDVFVDTENVFFNAIEGDISFSSDLLEIKEIRDGNSIINFWVEKPKISNKNILFSGISPGGYSGEKGFLFSIIFKSKKAGEGTLNFKNIKLLKNDENASLIDTKTKIFSFSIVQNIYSNESLSFKKIYEDTPPEAFRIEVSSSTDIFEGKNFAVFITQDKGSGVDYYAVKEGYFGTFSKAESPYILKYQNLDKKISVKAFDKNGNSRSVVFYPEPAKKILYRNIIIFFFTISGLFFLYEKKLKFKS